MSSEKQPNQESFFRRSIRELGTVAIAGVAAVLALDVLFGAGDISEF